MESATQDAGSQVEAQPEVDVRPVVGVAAGVVALLSDGTPNVLELSAADASIAEIVGDAGVRRLDAAETANSFAEEDAARLSHDDDSFDCAVLVAIVELLSREARDNLLAELRRVSRGGILIALPATAEDRHGEVVEALERGGDRVLELAADGATLRRLATYLALSAGGANGAPASTASRLEALLGEVSASASDRAWRIVVATPDRASDALALLAGDASVATGERWEVTAAALSAISQLGTELTERRRELYARERELVDARAGIARQHAQLSDVSHRLADALVTATEEARERELVQERLDAVVETRAWRVITRLQRARGFVARTLRRIGAGLTWPFRRLFALLTWPFRRLRGRG